jgi:hypothetical protein
MKNLITLLLAIFPFVAFAQNTSFGNFRIENQEIRYQQVFTQDSVTTAKLEEFYKAQPNISGVKSADGKITFDITDVTVDFRKYQFRQVDVPTLIQTGKYSAKATVEARDGRYRVTLTDIKVIGDAGYRKVTSLEPLTSFACKNSGTIMNPDWCKPNTLGLLDKVFTDLVKFVPKEKSDF